MSVRSVLASILAIVLPPRAQAEQHDTQRMLHAELAARADVREAKIDSKSKAIIYLRKQDGSAKPDRTGRCKHRHGD